MIEDVTPKRGRSGQMILVTVATDLTGPRGLAITEEQDLVYRDNPDPNAQPAAPHPVPGRAVWSRPATADPVLLFRYSALTFNGHRIHYDRDYVTKVEGYPGLIVHGPLQAALMVEFAAKLRGRMPKTFSYRGVQPLFEGSEFSINANDDGAGGMEMWVANALGQPTMKGVATW